MKCFSLSCLNALVVYFCLSHCHVFILSSSTHSMPLCRPDESSALLQFKASLQTTAAASPAWFCEDELPVDIASTWNESTDCCKSWYGVECDDATGHVTMLYLSCSRLKGTIRSNSSLFSLGHLEILYLSGNDFGRSAVLPEFGKFKNMTDLDLSYSNFSGDIPVEIAHLSKLFYFDLSTDLGDEKLRLGAATFGALALNLTELGFLSLNNVDMSSVSLHSIANLSSSIGDLFMSNCELNGELPHRIFSAFPNLRYLHLSGNNLRGRIPWSSFLNFELIESLDLSNNSFTGQIPKVFANFSSINSSIFASSLTYLSLSKNWLEGEIPSWIFKSPLSLLTFSSNHFTGKLVDEFYNTSSLSWKNLQAFDISSNSFSGPLPMFSSPLLSVYLASKNKFSGTIPASICKIKSLNYIDLSDNNLTGEIPECIGDLGQNLSLLNLQRNKIHGMIPPTFSKMYTLRNLNLNENELEGPLPQSLMFCKKLEVLDLGNNRFNDTFPGWLDLLPKLRVLILRDNMFHGPIGNPISKSPFPELRIIDLSHNVFSGALPAKYFGNMKAMTMNAEKGHQIKYMGDDFYTDTATVTWEGFLVELVKIQTIFTSIDLSNNNFTGEIPDLIGNLKSLKGLNLSHNMLRETIPSSLGNLTDLEWLDLSSNQLVGTIPSELLDITSLQFLNLSLNHLVGPIPQGKQFNTFSNDSFLENSGLCGFPLTENCGGSPLSPTLEQEDSSTGNEFNWNIVWMGFASGFVIGVSIGYMLLYSNGRLSWLCNRIEAELKQKIKEWQTEKKEKAKALRMARQ